MTESKRNRVDRLLGGHVQDLVVAFHALREAHAHRPGAYVLAAFVQTFREALADVGTGLEALLAPPKPRAPRKPRRCVVRRAK